MKSKTKYPDCYLHISEMRSGEEWILEIGEDRKLDLKCLVEQWIDGEFCGECKLDGELMPKLEGEYYARIMTDGRPSTSVVCWDGAGFFVTTK